jgi:hypothetical protein
MRYFANEIIRAIRSWRFAVSLIFSLGLLYLGLVAFYNLNPSPPQGWHFAFYNAYDAWIRAVSAGAFTLFAPLAATLPYADSFAQERSQKLSRYILLRVKHKHYLLTKFFVNGLSGGLAVALPMAIFFGFTSLKYVRILPPTSSSGYTEDWMRCYGFLSEFYLSAPDLYVFYRSLLGFAFGLVFATLGMAISAFTNNRYIILSFPLIFKFIVAFGVNFLGIPVFSPDYVLDPGGILDSTALTTFLPLGFILTVSLAIVVIRIRKYNGTPY